MAIASPINSFVDFNDPEIDCYGNDQAAALPVFDNFGIKFQIKVIDELLPTTTVFKAAVCALNCDNVVYNPGYEVIPICSRYVFGINGAVIEDSNYPITIGNYAPGPGQPQLPEGTYSKQQLIDLIEQYYGYALPGFDYYSCCDAPTISGIVIFFNGGGLAQILSLNQYYGYGYVNFPAEDMDAYIAVGECFRYCILDESDEVIKCSNIFNRIGDECLTTVFTYYNEENAYDFRYVVYDDNGVDRITENTVRLWVAFDRPRHLVEEEVFRRSDRKQQRLSTLIEKEWPASTSYLSIMQHDKLVVLLKHDFLHVYNKERGLNRQMVQIGVPEVPDLPMRSHPTYPVNFNMRDFNSSYVNNNCGFNCGVELVDSCENDGAITEPCPEKFKVEFQLATGQSTYQNNLLIGKTEQQIEVYREGLFQYSDQISLNSGTGVLTFTPAGFNNERIAIIEI